MGNINNDFIFFLQFSDDSEEDINFRVTQTCRRLIKADHFEIFPAVCFHNFDHLLKGDAQILNFCGRIDWQPEILNNGGSHLVRFFYINNSEIVYRHSSQKNIFGNGQFHQNLTFLINDADSLFDCFLGRVEFLFNAINQIFPFIRLVIAVQNFKKSGFSGSVFSQKC